MRAFLVRNARTLAVAVVAAVVASVATAGAASLITGKQIKDGSISAKDLNKAVRAQLGKAGVPGPPGPKGDTGPAGAKGDTGSPGPGTLLTAVADVPDGTFDREILVLPGLGAVVSSCSNASPNYTATFKNTSGQTIDWERQAATSGGGTEAVGTAPDGSATGGIGSSGNATIQVTLPAAGDRGARIAVIRIAQRLLGSACRVSASAVAN